MAAFAGVYLIAPVVWPLIIRGLLQIPFVRQHIVHPHVDQRERGLEAARLIVDRLHGKVTPHLAAVFPPLGISIDKQCTDEAPLAPLMERIDAVRQRPGILTASLWQGFPYADVVEMGAAVTVVSDGDQGTAQREAAGIAETLWEMRAALQVDLPNVPDAVERAQRLPGPVCLLDVGDNVGGGSAGDGTALAAELHRRAAGRSFVCIYDPESVAVAEAAGVGETRTFRVGGKTDRLHGETLSADCRILDLFDGRFFEPEIRHGGIQHQGRTGLVEVAAANLRRIAGTRWRRGCSDYLEEARNAPTAFRTALRESAGYLAKTVSGIASTSSRKRAASTNPASMKCRASSRSRRKPRTTFESICEYGS